LVIVNESHDEIMQPLTADTLGGTWSTLLLPINEDDSIDLERLSGQIDRLIQFKVDGIYTNGTAGEFDNQTEVEFEQISQRLSEACHAAQVPFQIGVSHSSPILSRDRLRRVVALRPSAIQLILPDWSQISLREAIRFLRTMAEEAEGIGLVLYNPPHAKRCLLPGEFARIKQAVPNLIGLKVLGGDAAWFEEMTRLAPDLSIFVAGHLLAEKHPFGARGSYSNVACINPRAARDWQRTMKTDASAALELGARIQGFMQDHIVLFLEQGYSNQAVDKLLACIGAWADLTPRLRWPYAWISGDEVERLRPLAQEQLPEFFL